MPIPAKKPKHDPKIFTHARGWLRDRIVIRRQEGPMGGQDVDVHLNGFTITIPREVECDVAKPMVQVLREAISTHNYRDEKNIEHTRDVQRYPFEVIAENVNWDDVMKNPEYAPMNMAYLEAVGKGLPSSKTTMPSQESAPEGVAQEV